MATRLKKMMQPILKQKCSESFLAGYDKGVEHGWNKKLLAYENKIGFLELLLSKRWIPVTERLPEEDGWYQVWTKTPFGGFKSFNKAQFYCGEWHGSGGIWTNVTHWMPLPEPPKGD